MIIGSSDTDVLELDGIVTNTGELAGVGKAGLLIQNNVNNTGGLIHAVGGSLGQVEIDNGATIVGGTLQNTGGTFIIANASLDGGGTHPITLVGDIAADTGQNLFTQGVFQNPLGTLDLQSASSLLLGFSNTTGIDTTFSGGDQISLTNVTIDLNPLTHLGSTPLKLNKVGLGDCPLGLVEYGHAERQRHDPTRRLRG